MSPNNAIRSWLVTTAVTTYSVWHPNPIKALRATEKYKCVSLTALPQSHRLRWWIALYAVVPLAFSIYSYTDLGSVGGVRCTLINLAESPQSILCAVKKTETEEVGLVWPLLAQIAIGTLLWIASLVAAITVLGIHCLWAC